MNRRRRSLKGSFAQRGWLCSNRYAMGHCAVALNNILYRGGYQWEGGGQTNFFKVQIETFHQVTLVRREGSGDNQRRNGGGSKDTRDDTKLEMAALSQWTSL